MGKSVNDQLPEGGWAQFSGGVVDRFVDAAKGIDQFRVFIYGGVVDFPANLQNARRGRRIL
jgi:hypothetical protein